MQKKRKSHSSNLEPHISSDTIKSTLRYIFSGFMILFATQASSIIIGINRFGIERKWGIEEFSKISLAIALSNMVLRCVNSISVVMFPTLRNIDVKKLPMIYKNVNVALMALIFIMMCFFKPMCYIIGLWLPQYANSLKYSILLLPICIYECKYSLLINTNLKTLNKEKSIGAINAVSVAVSFITAFISIGIMKNMELAVVGILIALSIRSIIGEWIISRIFNINIIKNVIAEFIISIMFIICMYYNNGFMFYFMYLSVVCFYMLSEKSELHNMLILLKSRAVSQKILNSYKQR